MAKQPKSKATRTRRAVRHRSADRLLTIEEIERLRAWAFAATARGERNGALVVALLGTAGRRFEVAALRVGDFRMGPDGPECCFPETKGGGSATVPVTPDTYEAIRFYIAYRRTVSALAPLFVSERGGFMDPTTVWRAFNRALREAGIDRRVGVHATRHAAGFLLLRAAGGDLTKVQVFLRHASLSTTASWYKHVHMPDLRAAMEKAKL